MVLGAMLALPACGGDDDGDSAAPPSATTPAASPTAGAASQEEAVKTALAYTGGTAGKADASATPIVIGWFNQDGGLGAARWYTDSVRAGVKFLNEQLGGIDGHPVKLQECTNATDPEQGQACAQKFLNDDNVKAIFGGEGYGGKATFMKAIGDSDTPFFGLSPQGPDDVKLNNVFFLRPAILALGAQATYMRDIGKVKNVTNIFPDTPDIRPIAQIYPPLFKAADVAIDNAFIKPGAPDFVAPLISGKIQSADGIINNSSDGAFCVSVSKALKQLNVDNKPTLAYSTCLDPSVKKALGDYPKGTTYYQDYPNVNLPDPSGQVGTFLYAIDKYGVPEVKDQFGAPSAFAGVLTIARWLSDDPENISLASVKKAATSDSEPIFLGEKPNFGKQPYPGVAFNSSRFYTYLGDGKWEDATDGKWLAPPAGGLL